MRSLGSPCLALDSRLGPTTALSGQGLFYKLGRVLHSHEVSSTVTPSHGPCHAARPLQQCRHADWNSRCCIEQPSLLVSIIALLRAG
jgi:hypothetical protein